MSAAPAVPALARLLPTVAAVVTAVELAVMPATAGTGATADPAVSPVGVAHAAGAKLTAAATATQAASRGPTAAAATTAGTGTTKGPVGWDTYRRLGQLPALPVGVETKQFSSFDRLQVNRDFNHTLRQFPGGGYVLAERTGPGEIDSIWTTSNGGDVTQTGNIHVVLDGKTVLDAPEQDVVDGKLGAPFVYPLVANATQSSGGAVIMVPMPYRSSMLVWTDHDPVYYHVTYRTFADADGVSTFDPGDKAQDVLNTLNAAGTRDPKPPMPGASTANTSFTLAPGKSTTLATGNGTGEVTALKLALPQLVAQPQPTYVADDGRAFGRDSNAYSQFTVKINPANQGVRLTRRIDAGVASQVADVYVDGQKVAQWAANASAGQCHWNDESVDLPASATAGKSQITIKNQFVSSANDFNEFYYWVSSNIGGAWRQTDTLDVGTGHTADEAAHSYADNEQTWSGTWSYCYPLATSDQQPAQATDDILSNVRVRISFDGQQTADAPLGEFFGDGLGLYPVKALMYGVDPASKQFSAWWPMPYQRGFAVTLYNGSSETLSSGRSAVTSAHDPAVAAGLSPAGQLGYFHATNDQSHTTPGADHQYLGASGWGKFVGVTSTNRGDPGYGRGYMEGNERAYVDGSNTPQITGTGTEDFYEGGWYFNNGPFSNPINGNPAQEDSTYAGCESDCIGAYRLWLADAVTFNDGINLGIEHGPTDNVPGVYGSTAYWYGRSRDVMRQSDTLTVGNATSEQGHGYTSPNPGTVQSLTATYEGDDGPSNGRLPVYETHTVRATTSPISFHLAVDPANRGVVLRRTSDQDTGYQAAEVYVNGQDAGEWLEPLANPYHRWLDDIYQLPASLTSGQHQLSIKLAPLSASPPWSAASYQSLSLVSPYNGPAVVGAGSVSPAEMYLRPGGSATAKLTFTSQAAATQTVTWSVTAPNGVAVSPSSGRLSVPAKGSASTEVAVTAGNADGDFGVTFPGSSAAGSYAAATLSTIVARPGDLAPYYNNVGIGNDGLAGQANYDGGGWSYSQQALTAAGLAPGATVKADGLTYTWPNAPAGQPDNIMAAGQTIPVAAPTGATELGFLGSAANAATGSQGTVTVTYTDGTSSTAALGMSDWALGGNPSAMPLFGNVVAAAMPHRDFADGTTQTLKMYVFSAAIPVNADKTIASVTLPDSLTHGSIGIFAISAG